MPILDNPTAINPETMKTGIITTHAAIEINEIGSGWKSCFRAANSNAEIMA